ncbi:MAG: type IV secretory system conjugative DNA transfer family protein [Ferrimicrobium sp.]
MSVLGDGLAAALVLALMMLPRQRGGSPRSAPTTHRLPSMRFGHPVPTGAYRVVVSLSRYRQILVPSESSLLVVGASRTGKTRRVIIPNLKRWPGFVLVTSVKTDILDADVRRARSNRGSIVVLGDQRHATHLWNPAIDAIDGESARTLAHLITRCHSAYQLATGEGRFWYQLGEPVLAGALRVANVYGGGLGGWIDGDRTLDTLLDGIGEKVLAGEITHLLRMDPRQWTSVVATVRSLVISIDAVAEGVGIPIGLTELMANLNGTMFLSAPVAQQEAYSHYFSALITAVTERSLSQPRDGSGRLLVLLDEAANIAPVPDLGRLASLGLGQGLTLVTVVQDLSQLTHLYGTSAGSVINNHRTKLFLADSGDPVTRLYLRDIVSTQRWPLLIEPNGRVSWLAGCSGRIRA